jgi:hypothetical protein
LPQFYVSPSGDGSSDGSNYIFDTSFTSEDDFDFGEEPTAVG